MICGKSNRNISFNQFYILVYFQWFTTMFKLRLSFLLLTLKMYVLHKLATFNVGLLPYCILRLVIFKPLSYYFEETIGFDVKAS